MNTENEKAVRDPMRKQAEKAYVAAAFDYESNPVGSRDWTIWWKAWQAALQSQVSNTSQDGSSEATRHATALEQCAIFAADVGDNIAKAMTDAAAYLQTVSTPPQQQEQSGEALTASEAAEIAKTIKWAMNPASKGGWYMPQGWNVILSKLEAIQSPATPTATASQESAPEAGGEARPVAYRAWLDDERGARWVFTLWPEEEHLEVIWEPLFLAPPTSIAIQAAEAVSKILNEWHDYTPGTNYKRLQSLLSKLTPANAEAELEVLMKGWKEAAIAWEVCASIHREYAKGKDALFTTRQADYTRHANEARRVLDEAKGEVK